MSEEKKSEKIELTISTGYVPKWGAWEGIREIVQNALDAADDGHEMAVSHDGDTLTVSSAGAKLDRNVLLLGTTSKDSGAYRGHFGEGLKLGVMALVRAGHCLKIVNGDELWTPRIECVEKWGGEELLTVEIVEADSNKGMFSVEVDGVNKDLWLKLRKRFIHLAEPKRVVETSRGGVLLDRSFKGQMFVKGIYVCFNAKLKAGYDFKFAATDRDRQMISNSEMNWEAARMWEEAMTKEPTREVAGRVIKMLNDGAADVEGLGGGYSANSGPLSKAIATQFRKDHGSDAVPVRSMAESREADHLGKKGVVVAEPLAKVLSGEVNDLYQARVEHKKAVATIHAWTDLDKEEQARWVMVMDIVEPAARALGHSAVAPRTTVVDFNDPTTMGLHRGNGDVQIARWVMRSFRDLLETVVHEVGHDVAADGAVGHERSQANLFSWMIEGFMSDGGAK